MQKLLIGIAVMLVVVSDVKFIGELGIPNIRMKRLSEMPKQPTGRIPLEVLK